MQRSLEKSRTILPNCRYLTKYTKICSYRWLFAYFSIFLTILTSNSLIKYSSNSLLIPQSHKMIEMDFTNCPNKFQFPHLKPTKRIYISVHTRINLRLCVLKFADHKTHNQHFVEQCRITGCRLQLDALQIIIVTFVINSTTHLQTTKATYIPVINTHMWIYVCRATTITPLICT